MYERMMAILDELMDAKDEQRRALLAEYDRLNQELYGEYLDELTA